MTRFSDILHFTGIEGSVSERHFEKDINTYLLNHFLTCLITYLLNHLLTHLLN